MDNNLKLFPCGKDGLNFDMYKSIQSIQVCWSYSEESKFSIENISNRKKIQCQSKSLDI